MRLRSVASVLLPSLLLGLIVTFGAATPVSAGRTFEAKLLDRINTSRANHGLAPVRKRAGLSDYAERHSRSMSRQRTLFHTADFRVLCCWSSVSENVAVGDSIRSIHRSLMRSPAHRANILDPTKSAVGLGVVPSGGHLWVTEVFRQPR